MMSELFTVPRIVIGNRQLVPDATLMSPVEFSPQSASSASLGQSEAAGAADADIEPVTPTASARTATVNNRIIDLLIALSRLLNGHVVCVDRRPGAIGHFGRRHAGLVEAAAEA